MSRKELVIPSFKPGRPRLYDRQQMLIYWANHPTLRANAIAKVFRCSVRTIQRIAKEAQASLDRSEK